jgi:hypothetical protein
MTRRARLIDGAFSIIRNMCCSPLLMLQESWQEYRNKKALRKGPPNGGPDSWVKTRVKGSDT